mmetsp:Transcript_4800/g.16920  ORF Transcript_4800/g.16920 Transcript_4800/m.16920 type:complete len:302 (+) Transcript_4800:2183-3088(+)
MLDEELQVLVIIYARLRCGALEVAVEVLLVQVVPHDSEALLGEGLEAVGGLADHGEVLGGEIGVADEAAAHDLLLLPGTVTLASCTCLELGHVLAVEPAELGPVRDLELLHAVEEDVEVEANEVVADDYVGVDLGEARHQHGEELALCLACAELVAGKLDLLEALRPRRVLELPDGRERLDALLPVERWHVGRHTVVDEARHHHDLVRSLLVVENGVDLKREDGERRVRRRLLLGHREDKVRVVHGPLLLAPRHAASRGLLGLLHLQPLWSHDPLLEEETLEHGLVAAKDVREGLSLEVGG